MTDKLKILLDLDGTINYAPNFFSQFTRAMKDIAEIHVVTYRLDHQKDETVAELANLNISYHHLVLTKEKLEYALTKGINVVFEDTDEMFKYMPESILVMKVRETDNFDFKSRRWVYDDNTGIHIDDVPVVRKPRKG